MKPAELEALYKHDPEKAFAELGADTMYTSNLLTAAMRFLGRYATKELAEDCVQETFIRTFQSSTTSKDHATPLKKRMYLNLRQRCAIEVRNHQRREFALRQLRSEGTSSPEFSFLTEGEPEEIQTAINQLSDRKRQILYLHYYADMSISAIAEYLDIKPQTCTRRLAEAEEQLRQYLGARYADRFSRTITLENPSDTVVDDTTSDTDLLQLFRQKHA